MDGYYDFTTYEERLNKKYAQPYRKIVANIVEGWDREKLHLFLDNHEDRINDGEPKFPSHSQRQDLSTDDLRKLVCMAVWGWGWEGSDYFIKMYSQSPRRYKYESQ